MVTKLYPWDKAVKQYPWDVPFEDTTVLSQGRDVEGTFPNIFPDMEYVDVLSYAAEKPEDFLADIQKKGWTAETEAAIRFFIPEASKEDLQGLFGTVAPFEPEYAFKDNFIDPLRSGAVAFGQDSKTRFWSTLPSIMWDLGAAIKNIGYDILSLPAKTGAFLGLLMEGKSINEASSISSQMGEKAMEPITITTDEVLSRVIPDIQKSAEQNFIRLTEEHDTWWEEHPELVPNPKYALNPFENPELLKDPGYYAFSFSSSLAYSLSVMGTMVAVSAIGTPIAGVTAGIMVAGGPEATAMTEELLDQGVPFREAAQWGEMYGFVAGGIEVASDLFLLGLVAKPFNSVTKPFRDLILKLTVNNVVKGIAAGTLVVGIEGMEEAITQAAHNAVLQQYDETVKITDGMSHAFIQGVIATLPFGVWGGMASTNTFRKSLSPDVKDRFDSLVAKFQKHGLSLGQAQIQATKELARTYETEIAKALEITRNEYLESQNFASIEEAGEARWATITGEVPTGVAFAPVTTPVGMGYEIVQKGERVGLISYATNIPGVDGWIIDRIDITERARRQGLATQAIDRVLSGAEAAGKPLYTGMLEPDGVQFLTALEQRGVITLTPAPQRMLGNVVTRGVAGYAPTTAMAEGEAITGEVPVGEVEVIRVPTNAKQLRQTIMAIAKGKKLSETKYRALFKKVGGVKKLTDMGVNELTNVLEAIRETRPVKIKGSTVVTRKTERAIQTLRNRLIAEKKLTPEIYEKLKNELGLETDRYESRELYITERQARSLIRQMNVEAEVGITNWDVRVAEGLVNKPELQTEIDKLTRRIVTENKPKPKKNIWIPFRKEASEVSAFPDDVKLSGMMSFLRALRRFQEQLGGREITRIYEVAEMMIEQRRLNEILLANTINAMKMQVPQLATIVQDKKAMERIQQWLDSDLKITDIAKPDLIADELEVAQLFRSRYDQWKDTVRFERFKDAYYHFGGRRKDIVAELIKYGTEESKDVSIPDAPLKDIKEAVGIYETQGETALLEYLKTKDWGVIKSGYSFSQILHPKLRLYRGTSVRATTTSLHQRKGLEFLRDERTSWERLIAYERQMIGLNLQSYFRKMDTEFRRAQEGGRISPESANSAANKISLFMREVKGYPIENPAVAFLLRMGGWSFGTLAKLPWMSTRNLHQNIAFMIDKIEAIKAIATGGFFGNHLMKRGRLDYTDALVHQYKGVQQEQILMGYMGKTPLENLIRKTDYYHLSDKLNRYLCMAGQGAKAERALNQYLKDGDVEKFLRNSGANELSATEQIRILEYLALDTYDYGGVLESVSGGEAAVRDIANRITTLTHFNYVRYLRASVEMGEVGRVLGSLVAFPRSVVERYVDIFGRGKRLGGADRKRAIHSLMSMVVGSAIASALLRQLTGRDRDAYNPFLIIQWQVGGLATGAAQELMEFYRLLTNLTLADTESQRKYYGDEIVLLIPRLGDMFIPFYGVTMNLLESLGNARYIDRKWLRQIRETFDENYELNEEYYKIERDMLEGIQHGLFGTKTPDPSDLETALKKLEGTQEMLGQIDTAEFENARQGAEEAGRLEEWSAKYTEEDFLYTTNNLGTDIGRAINNLDPSEITIGNGFSELVLEYMEYQTLHEEYKWSPSDKRFEYREENPETDAQLFFWSYVTTLQSDTAKQIVTQMITRYGIPALGIRGYDSEFGGGGGQYPWESGYTGESETTPKYPWDK